MVVLIHNYIMLFIHIDPDQGPRLKAYFVYHLFIVLTDPRDTRTLS